MFSSCNIPRFLFLYTSYIHITYIPLSIVYERCRDGKHDILTSYVIRSPSWPVWSPSLPPPPATPPPSPGPMQPPTTPLWSSPRSRFWSLRQAKHQQQSSPQVCIHQDGFRTPENKNGGGFRFPPWSGPSPRTNSSPGLLPPTPDSPR